MISQQPAMVDYRVCLNVDACCFYKNSGNSTYSNWKWPICHLPYNIYIYLVKVAIFHLKNLVVSPDGQLLCGTVCHPEIGALACDRRCLPALPNLTGMQVPPVRSGFGDEARHDSWKWMGNDGNGFVWKWLVPLHPMVLLIIIPFVNGYFIGGIPHFQTYPNDGNDGNEIVLLEKWFMRLFCWKKMISP